MLSNDYALSRFKYVGGAAVVEVSRLQQYVVSKYSCLEEACNAESSQDFFLNRCQEILGSYSGAKKHIILGCFELDSIPFYLRNTTFTH